MTHNLCFGKVLSLETVGVWVFSGFQVSESAEKGKKHENELLDWVGLFKLNITVGGLVRCFLCIFYLPRQLKQKFNVFFFDSCIGIHKPKVPTPNFVWEWE